MTTVMVVDDDRLLRESLCELVADLGCLSIPADSGRQALNLFEQALACDLIVSDIDMPDMSGFELLAQLQRHYPVYPPLILMSARADQHLRQQAEAAGARRLFAKPFPFGDFSRALRQLLSLPDAS